MADRAPPRWLVIKIPKPDDEITAEGFVEVLASLSKRGVEERGTDLIAYFDPEGRDSGQIVEAVRARLGSVAPGSRAEPQFQWQAHEDWAQLWRQGIARRRVGRRFLVSPTWMDPQARPDDLVIRMDPGIAFGTAEHPTTRGCLRLLEAFVRRGDRVADVGSGSGILSIASILLGAEAVRAVDLDPWACATTAENARLNRVEDRVEVIESEVGLDPLPDSGNLDGLVANVEAGVLIPRLRGFRGSLRPGGWMILGGLTIDDSVELMEDAGRAGLELVEADVEEGWWSAGFRA
jgi:ribosomal protein L11 methyltransferase